MQQRWMKKPENQFEKIEIIKTSQSKKLHNII